MALIDRDTLGRYLSDIALTISGQISESERYETLQEIMERGDNYGAAGTVSVLWWTGVYS